MCLYISGDHWKTIGLLVSLFLCPCGCFCIKTCVIELWLTNKVNFCLFPDNSTYNLWVLHCLLFYYMDLCYILYIVFHSCKFDSWIFLFLRFTKTYFTALHTNVGCITVSSDSETSSSTSFKSEWLMSSLKLISMTMFPKYIRSNFSFSSTNLQTLTVLVVVHDTLASLLSFSRYHFKVVLSNIVYIFSERQTVLNRVFSLDETNSWRQIW